MALVRRPSTPVLIIIVVFVVSRAAAYVAGLRFDDGMLHNAFQLLDVRLLRDDPVVSIFYLHSQPPLFNAFTAVVVQLPDSFVNTVLALVWHAAALGTGVALYATMVRLGVRTRLAIGLVCAFLLAPETILTEHWFFYSQLQMLLSALALLGLARYTATRTTRDGMLFTASIGALVLLRSSFHIAVMVVVLIAVCRMLKVDARKFAAIAAVPLVLAGAWSVKNLVLFDSPTSSTWLGMNLSYLAQAGTTTAECRALVADRTVSSLACQRAFRRPEAYERAFPHPEEFGVDATDRVVKSTGQANFNASLYRDVASRLQHDSIELFREGGVGAVARAELAAYTVWAEPGDDSLQLRKVREPIAGYADWFDRLVLFRPTASGFKNPSRFGANAGAFPVGEALGSISYTLLGLFALALYGGVAGWRRGSRGVAAERDDVMRTVCSVALGLLVFSVIVGNALDFRENNRFRVEAWPFTLVLAAVGAELLLRRLAARRAAVWEVSSPSNPLAR
jgi:hypothetical protein